MGWIGTYLTCMDRSRPEEGLPHVFEFLAVNAKLTPYLVMSLSPNALRFPLAGRMHKLYSGIFDHRPILSWASHSTFIIGY
jgi:hypothetical protein